MAEDETEVVHVELTSEEYATLTEMAKTNGYDDVDSFAEYLIADALKSGMFENFLKEVVKSELITR